MASVGSETPYCTPASLFYYVDSGIVADGLAEANQPAPSLAAMLDVSSAAGARLYRLCQAGSGDLEARLMATGRYSAADLQGLTGNSGALLEKIAAGLTLVAVFERKQPSTGRVEDLPAVKRALDSLEELRKGATVLGIAADIDVGAGGEVTTFVDPGDFNRTAARMNRVLARWPRWGWWG